MTALVCLNRFVPMPRTATHCRTMQHSANTLQHSANSATLCTTLHHTVPQCNTLQHTATHCNTLQHTATHRNTLQHTATHCNTLSSCYTHTLLTPCFSAENGQRQGGGGKRGRGSDGGYPRLFSTREQSIPLLPPPTHHTT